MEGLIAIIFGIGLIIMLLLYVRQANITKQYSEELERLMKKIFLESDLIEQSFKTIEYAYRIPEGDLKDFIASKQKKESTKDKKESNK